MNKFPICFALAAVAAFPQAQTPLTITQSAGSATGELRMQERRTNGTDYVGLKAPQSVASSVTWTLPAADGTAAQCLQTDGAGVLSFAACAGYWTLSGSDIYRSTGLVTIGHTAATVRLGQNFNTNYAGNYGGAALNTFSATGAHGSVLDFNKSASGTLGAHGAVASGDTLGFFVFRGSDGTAFQRASEVLGEVDGTVSSGVVPGRIRFRTANSSGTITERWRIDSSGHLTAGTHDSWDFGTSTSAGSARSIFAGTSVVTPKIGRNTAASLAIMTDSTTRWNYTSAGMLLPATTDTYDIGDLTTPLRVRAIYPKIIDTALSGGTGDYIQTRKVQLFDNTGSTSGASFWDLNVVMSGAGAFQNSYFYLRDNAGTNVFKSERIASGSAVSRTTWYTDLLPNSTGGRNLGSSSLHWGNVYADTLATDLFPITTDSITLGNGTSRWAKVRSLDLQADGYVTFSSGAADGYIWTSDSAGVGSWQPSTGLDAYDVRNFGAVCNGVADDTTAIINAIAAGSANKHKAILPQGTCLVTTITISNSYAGIRGQGRSNSILRSTTNAPIIKIDNASPVYYLEFSDFSLKGGDVGTSQTGIESATAGFGVSTIHNIYFENLYRGIKLGHTTNLGDVNIFDNAFSMGGDAVASASMANGTVYVIGSVGTTDFTTFGAASNTVGLSFTKSGGTGTGTGVVYLSSVFSKVGIESLDTSSGSIWSRNFFGGLALPSGATAGPRAFYLHGYVGDTIMSDNHMEGGWIGFDISCDNGTFATGLCSYGENLVINDNKIDGYALDFRLYNVHNSTILGNRGRAVLDAQITGTSTSGMIYDVVGRVDSGSAIERAGVKYTTSTGDTAINAYDEGRIRIGVTTSNISNARNGISIQDQGASSAIALGQSATRNMGMLWNYNATAGSAYGLVYTYSYSNPMLYGASSHQFVGANGPSLGAGQNISPVWVSGTSGFIGYGLYRTDDTNGGWLIGTSGVSVGDFAIYQNQGAGSPARRFRIESSGGAVDMTSLKIGGTTAIDSSRNGSFAGLSWTGNLSNSITFSSGSTYNVGSSGAPPLNVYGNYIEPITALVLSSGTRVTGDIVPSSSVTYSLGYAANKFSAAYVTNMYIYGAVQAPSGSIGASSALSCGSGQAIKAITVDAGIVTSVSCGTP